MYKYFISYNYITKNGFGFGFGSCDCITDKKIEEFEHIESIRKKIKKENKEFKDVMILNYKLLKEEKQ